MTPFLSIIIPVYNKGKYLDKCIRSIVEQSFSNWEVILVDDGSTDCSADICDRWHITDSRIQVIHQKNSGVSVARNEGMKLARGEYLQFTDADDWWECDAFRRLYQEIENFNKPEILVFGLTKVVQGGSRFIRHPEMAGVFERKPFFAKLIKEQSESGVYGCVANKLLSRSLAVNNHLSFNPKHRLMEDFDLFLSAYNQSETIAQSHYSGYFYLQDAENSSSGAAFRFHYPNVMSIRVKAWQLAEQACGKNPANDAWLQKEANALYLGMYVESDKTNRQHLVNLDKEFVQVLPLNLKPIPEGNTHNTRFISFLLRRRWFSLLSIFLSCRHMWNRTSPAEKNCKQNKEFLQMQTAILGMWWGWNYGALLTSYSLYRVVEELGYDPFLLDHAPMSETWEHCAKLPSPFRRFLQSEGIRIIPVSSVKQAGNIGKVYHNFIVGSDQLWRHQYIHEFGTQFFLDFVAAGKRKIAYATSMGDTGADVPEEFRSIATRLLSHFDAISLREYSGVSELARLYKTDGVQTIDPVFLPKTDFWKTLAAKVPALAESYTLSYILDSNHQIEKILRHVQPAGESKQVLITDYEKPVSLADAPPYDIVLNQITPPEWLSAIANCNLMVTDSFHGACFAIIFNKPFVCLMNERRGATRFHTLQQLFPDLAHRFITPPDIPAEVHKQDFSEVNACLQRERERCRLWLKESLQCTPKQHNHVEGLPPCKKPGKLRMLLYRLKQRILSR